VRINVKSYWRALALTALVVGPILLVALAVRLFLPGLYAH